MKFNPTKLEEEKNYTFTLGDKIKFYHRNKDKKQWKSFSDTNPYYLGLIELHSKMYLGFFNIQLDAMTNGKWIRRLCPPQPIVNRETVKFKSGIWKTNVTICCTHYFNHYEIGYIVIPQVEKTHHDNTPLRGR